MRLRRVGVTAPHFRDVAQLEQFVAGADADGADRLDAVETAGHADADAVAVAVDEAGRRHRVLRLQRLLDQARVQAQCGELGGRHFDPDALVLHADQIDLGHVRHPAQLQRDGVGLTAQFGQRVAITGQGEDIAEGVAEFVIGKRPLHPGGQVLADIVDLLAHLIPEFRHLLRRREIAQLDEHQRLARLGVTAQAVQIGQFLQFSFDAVSNLLLHFARCRTWPERTNHHDLDGEIRVFRATQIEKGQNAADGQHHHEIRHQAGMRQRPGREIEGFHGTDTRTASASISLCAPAATMRSPATRPALTATPSSRQAATVTGRRCTRL